MDYFDFFDMHRVATHAIPNGLCKSVILSNRQMYPRDISTGAQRRIGLLD